MQRFGRQLRVEAGERVAQPLRENGLAVVASLGRGHAGRDIGAVGDPPADAREPGEDSDFDIGFGGGNHSDPTSSAALATRRSIAEKC